jgi:hypothetical protein
MNNVYLSDITNTTSTLAPTSIKVFSRSIYSLITFPDANLIIVGGDKGVEVITLEQNNKSMKYKGTYDQWARQQIMSKSFEIYDNNYYGMVMSKIGAT